MSEWSGAVRPTGGPPRLTGSYKSKISNAPLRDIVYATEKALLRSREDRAKFRLGIRDLPATTFDEWLSIPLPPGLKAPEHVRITDAVVDRTPKQIDDAFRTYKYKIEYLLENKYTEAAHYKVVVNEDGASKYGGDVMAEVLGSRPPLRIGDAESGPVDKPQIVLYKRVMRKVSEIEVFLVVLHEIAHILDKSDAIFRDAHNDLWRNICLQIGGDGNRYGDRAVSNVGYTWLEDVRSTLVFRCDHDGPDPCFTTKPSSYHLGEDRTTDFIEHHVDRNTGRLVDLSPHFVCDKHQTPWGSIEPPPPFKSSGAYANFLFEKYVEG